MWGGWGFGCCLCMYTCGHFFYIFISFEVMENTSKSAAFQFHLYVLTLTSRSSPCQLRHRGPKLMQNCVNLQQELPSFI